MTTNESATREGVLEKGKTDWEAVERQYRAGVISIRQLAKSHELSDTAIRKKAKELGWERDLSDKVAQQARSDLVRSRFAPSTDASEVRTEREIILAGAAMQVAVVQEHRADIAAARRFVNLLMHQLSCVAVAREHFEDMVMEETAEDKGGKRRAFLMAAVSLPRHAATMRDLATAMAKLIPLERTAFSIGDQPPEEPEQEVGTVRVLDGFNEVRAAFDRALGIHGLRPSGG